MGYGGFGHRGNKPVPGRKTAPPPPPLPRPQQPPSPSLCLWSIYCAMMHLQLCEAEFQKKQHTIAVPHEDGGRLFIEKKLYINTGKSRHFNCPQLILERLKSNASIEAPTWGNVEHHFHIPHKFPEFLPENVDSLCIRPALFVMPCACSVRFSLIHSYL